MQTVVLKLGGTSLTNGFNIIPTILNEYKTFYKIVLVFSAFSKITNLLEENDLKQVLKFPHRKDDDTKGAIVVYESPYKNQKQQVPHNLYIICHLYHKF